jgi:hypothetical protein
MANTDWLNTLMAGLGGAFTGYGQGQDRRAQAAQLALQNTRQAEQDREQGFTRTLQQRAALEEMGFVPTAQMPRGGTGSFAAPSAVGSVPVEAMVNTMRRGETIQTPGGQSFTQDRLRAPQTVERQRELTRQQEARSEIERRARGEREGRELTVSENAKDRAAALAAAKARQTQDLTTAQQGTQANILAARYDADPIVKNAKDIAQSYARINATQDNAAGDLSMIFAYMKMLDPGSVVREGEFANAQNAAGVPDQVKNLYNRAATGERLNPNQRAQFRQQAVALAEAQRQLLQQTRQRYIQRAQAGKLSIDPDLLFSDPFEMAPDAQPVTGESMVRSLMQSLNAAPVRSDRRP